MSRNTARRYSARNRERARPPELPPWISFPVCSLSDYREWVPRQGGNGQHALPSRCDRLTVSAGGNSALVWLGPPSTREPHPCPSNSTGPQKTSATRFISST